jgi:diguanylate cyclase (GGDEF)-like protein/PAS domain S-box-containing protein
MPSPSETVLALIRGEVSLPEAALAHAVAEAEVLGWQRAFLAAGSAALAGSNDQDNAADLITDPVTDPVTDPITDPITDPVMVSSSWDTTWDGVVLAEAKYQALLRAIPDLIVRIDANGVVKEYLNLPPGFPMLAPPSQRDGSRIDDFLPPETAALEHALIAACLRSGQPTFYEGNAETSAGLQYYESRFVPVGHHEVLALVRDISERKQTEAQLAEREALFRSVFNNTNIGIVLDEPYNDQVIEVNDAMTRILGYSREELLGEVKYHHYGFREDQELEQKLYQQLYRGEREFYEIEKRCYHKDGKILLIRIVVTIVRNQNHEPLFSIGMLEDITEKRNAEIALAEREALFRGVFDHANIGIILDLPGGARTLNVNPRLCEMLGYSRDELLGGVNFINYTHPDDLLAEDQLFVELIRGSRDDYELEKRCFRKDGTLIWVRATVTLARDASNRPIFALGLLEDITARKEAEMLLLQAQAETQAVNRELERLTMLDGLTQVANRRHFDRFLQQSWQRGLETGEPLGLILCDIDYFKRFNDSYGHQAGDECLIRVATALLNAAKRPNDLVARYGGEEFVLVLPLTDSYGVEAMARAVQREIAKLAIKHQGGKNALLTLSLGAVSMVPTSHWTITDLVRHADDALYAAKAAGRNQAVFAKMRAERLPSDTLTL